MTDRFLSKELSFVKCNNTESSKCCDCKFNSYKSEKGASILEDIPEFEVMYQSFLGKLNHILVELELFISGVMETRWNTSDVISQAKGISKDSLEEVCYSCMTADSSLFASVTEMVANIERLFNSGFNNLTEIESALSKIRYELKLLNDASEIVKVRKEDKR